MPASCGFTKGVGMNHENEFLNQALDADGAEEAWAEQAYGDDFEAVGLESACPALLGLHWREVPGVAFHSRDWR
jgi:hypothetical protein